MSAVPSDEVLQTCILIHILHIVIHSSDPKFCEGDPKSGVSNETQKCLGLVKYKGTLKTCCPMYVAHRQAYRSFLHLTNLSAA